MAFQNSAAKEDKTCMYFVGVFKENLGFWWCSGFSLLYIRIQDINFF